MSRTSERRLNLNMDSMVVECRPSVVGSRLLLWRVQMLHSLHYGVGIVENVEIAGRQGYLALRALCRVFRTARWQYVVSDSDVRCQPSRSVCYVSAG